LITERWLCRNGTSRVPYEKMAAHGGLKTHKVRIDESSRCFQSRPTNDGFAGTGQAAFPTKGWLCRKGTSHVDNGKMAAHGGLKTHKVRIDESSRCFQSRPTNDGFAGTNVSPYEKMATPERDKPRSLRKDGCAGTGQAAFPTERWLRRNGASRVPYGKMALPERDKPRSLRSRVREAVAGLLGGWFLGFTSLGLGCFARPVETKNNKNPAGVNSGGGRGSDRQLMERQSVP